MGIFQSIERPTYDDKVVDQLEYYSKMPGANDIDELLRGEDYWVIE
jgi:hypothetical protein